MRQQHHVRPQAHDFFNLSILEAPVFGSPSRYRPIRKASFATNRAHSPSAHTVSVSEGSNVMIRRGEESRPTRFVQNLAARWARPASVGAARRRSARAD